MQFYTNNLQCYAENSGKNHKHHENTSYTDQLRERTYKAEQTKTIQKHVAPFKINKQTKGVERSGDPDTHKIVVAIVHQQNKMTDLLCLLYCYSGTN
jgi:hypothetical protein